LKPVQRIDGFLPAKQRMSFVPCLSQNDRECVRNHLFVINDKGYAAASWSGGFSQVRFLSGPTRLPGWNWTTRLKMELRNTVTGLSHANRGERKLANISFIALQRRANGLRRLLALYYRSSGFEMHRIFILI
jgi:hypothetical protein